MSCVACMVDDALVMISGKLLRDDRGNRKMARSLVLMFDRLALIKADDQCALASDQYLFALLPALISVQLHPLNE